MEDLNNPEFNQHGYVQIYSGYGKGKTTACIGLATRALGRNFKVLIMQFCKVCNETGEYKCLSRNNKNLTYKSCGLPHYPTKKNIDNKDMAAARKGWCYVLDHYKKFDMIIMDELNIAIDFGFILVEEVLDFLNNKPDNLEIVISGRNANPQLIEIADLVTEMKLVKHYWDLGVKARVGVEF